MPINVYEYRFLHAKIVSKGSHYFPGKNKSFNILKIKKKNTTKLQEKLTRGRQNWQNPKLKIFGLSPSIQKTFLDIESSFVKGFSKFLWHILGLKEC